MKAFNQSIVLLVFLAGCGNQTQEQVDASVSELDAMVSLLKSGVSFNRFNDDLLTAKVAIDKHLAGVPAEETANVHRVVDELFVLRDLWAFKINPPRQYDTDAWCLSREQKSRGFGAFWRKEDADLFKAKFGDKMVTETTLETQEAGKLTLYISNLELAFQAAMEKAIASWEELKENQKQ